MSCQPDKPKLNNTHQELSFATVNLTNISQLTFLRLCNPRTKTASSANSHFASQNIKASSTASKTRTQEPREPLLQTKHQSFLYYSNNLESLFYKQNIKAFSTAPNTKTQNPISASLLLQMGNELNSDVKLAAQIVLGLFILIITLRLALPRFQQVELVLELISEVVGTLDLIVVLLLWLIHGIINAPADEGFQKVVSVLELIHDLVGSLVILVDLLLRLICIRKRIWSIWTAIQPGVVANDHQNEIPLADINYGQNDIPPTDAEADATNGQNDGIVNQEQSI